MKMERTIKKFLALGFGGILLFGCLSGCQNPVGNPEESSDSVIQNSEAVSEITDSEENAYVKSAEEIFADMTLEEKIGQMMIPAFRVWKDLRNVDDAGTEEGEEPEAVNITELNDEIRACVEKNHFGGVLLFGENFKDAEQSYKLIRDLQSSNQKGSEIPMFIATDQEGGYVVRTGFGTTGIGNMALAATGNPENAKEMAAIYGTELNALRINMDFAPVIDINNNPVNPVIGVRSFADDPGEVAKFGNAFMEGLKSTGVIATLKHFPGHGDTDTDSHTGFPLIDKSYDELKQFELVPYQASIDNGAEMIMTAHIQYPQIEKETYVSTSTGEEVYIPATMSRRILTEILRDDMGFDGVIVTDALDMRAITDNFEFEDVICMTINAGADMIILPGVTNTDIFEQTDGVVELTANLVKEGKISEDRIDDAVKRILKLKEKHGILADTNFSVSDTEIKQANQIAGSPANRERAWEIAKEALTLLTNENDAYPLTDPQNEKTLILFADSCASRVGYGELVKQMLTADDAMMAGADEDCITVMANTADNKEDCLKAAEEADNVILISRAYNAACLDPETGDGFSTAVFDDIIKMRHKNGKTVIVISCQLPYDAARFPDADAMILTYCSSSLRQVPNEAGEGSAYSPNLAAAIMACFTGEKLPGKLPVNIPKLDGKYQITDVILYERSGDFIQKGVTLDEDQQVSK